MAEQAYTVASDSETIGDEKSSSLFPEIAIGIDIGTSHCRAAIWHDSRVELLRSSRGHTSIRSCVAFRDVGPPTVGRPAGGELEVLSGSTVFNIKRLVGRSDLDSTVARAGESLPFLVQTLNIGVRPFVATLVQNAWRSTTPEEVLAVLLIEIRAMAEAHLGQPVRKAVLTVPVTFSRFQTTRVERACAMAGLHVLRLMPEPTSVALLYAQQQQRMQQNTNENFGSEKIAVIVNMGAGFCDVAVTATAGGVSQIKALSGVALGGEDLLVKTMRHLAPGPEGQFGIRGPEEIRRMGLLRVAVQEAIHGLSSRLDVGINVDLGNGRKICRVLSRQEFEEVNREIFDECENLIRTCLRDAKTDAKDLNDVILVGGCSNIPKIQEIVKGVCGREIYSGIDLFEGAVCGAALEGAVASGVNDPFGTLDLLTIQATSLGIGIRAHGNTFVPVIHPNTTVPVKRDVLFTTVHDNQTEALVVVYEGNDKAVEKNNLLGFFKITGIPPAPKGVPEIAICLDIDASIELRVFAGVVMPGGQGPVGPVMEVRMPTVDDGHGWCAGALDKAYGSSLDLATVQKSH
ncbi:Heat shock 70 kDa protein 8 [Striga hermonthica]|uniref:Heat shock 70 kDa protein 8 n=1 Tax=Striga hermonthica TaxID=68872 RepID=A0A9N7NMY2_STRHE|nr:Heat shock 70 kDa protein 8 [Striga hermonthica]